MDWHFKVKDPDAAKRGIHRSWYIGEKVGDSFPILQHALIFTRNGSSIVRLTRRPSNSHQMGLLGLVLQSRSKRKTDTSPCLKMPPLPTHLVQFARRNSRRNGLWMQMTLSGWTPFRSGERSTMRPAGRNIAKALVYPHRARPTPSWASERRRLVRLLRGRSLVLIDAAHHCGLACTV